MSQTELVQLCVRRGADAFMIKPLGSEEVRHIWQFVKDLPESTFKDEVTYARGSSTQPAKDSFSEPEQHAAVTAVKELSADSVLVCAGHAPSEPSPGASHTTAEPDDGTGRPADLSCENTRSCPLSLPQMIEDHVSLPPYPTMRRGIAQVRYPHAPSGRGHIDEQELSKEVVAANCAQQ
mmetsp:Transcript_6264/g.13007  ORF Transcript_6264/g.13007 Transcript_6264/m.13007 type:complete len:179 (-) Transcript_6264:219-755(-)